MKFPVAVAFLCLLAVSCAPPPAPEEPADTTAEDRAMIEGMIEPYEAAFNAADVDGIVAFYDEQAVRMPPNDRRPSESMVCASRWRTHSHKARPRSRLPRKT